MTLVVTAQVPPQRWKNGGGYLRELLLQPAAAAWQIRIAVADIDADGAFSEFPGVERWFSVVQGAGVELTVGDVPRSSSYRLTRNSQALRFDGAAVTRCRLINGSVVALNLMLRGARGRTDQVVGNQGWIADATSCGIYSNVAGRCNGFEMPAGSLLWFDVAPPRLSFTAASPGPEPSAWWLAATAEPMR